MKTRFATVSRLRQTKETWQCAQPLARAWITPDHQSPYRPFFLLVVNTKGKILLSEALSSEADPDQILDYLLRAMARPALGSGRSRRPQTIYFDSEELVAALTEPLNALDIGCKYRVSLANLNSVRKSLERGFGGSDAYPGLLSISGVTPPLVGHIFELAADYHKAKPWQLLNDRTPLVINYPPEADPRYAMVMGSGGEVFGLAIYDSVDHLKLMFSNLSSRQVMKRASWQVVYFESPLAMSFDDLDAIAQFDWPVANEMAYPLLGRTKSPTKMDLPTKADLLWLEGALEAILTFLPEAQKAANLFAYPDVDLDLTIHPIGGKAQLRLQTPDMDDLLGWDED